MFIADACTECATCLANCPHMQLTEPNARAQIRALKAGKPSRVLEECITCMACNELCPSGANPYDLILAAQEKQRVCMIPPEAVTMIEQTLAGQPSQVIPGDPERPALCLCTMEHACPPDMLSSSLLRGLTIARGGDFFSRVVYLHTGMESTVRAHAPRFIASLADLGHAEIVFMHADCYMLAAYKAPEYGITVPFRPVHIVEYLLRVLRKRRHEIRPLRRSVAWQRPCIDRYTPEVEPLVDELLDLINVHRVARLHDRHNALCCGLGLRSRDTERQRKLAERNSTDCCDHNAEAMVFLCPGCYAALGPACASKGLNAIFLTDLCRMAIGELPWSSRPLLPSPPRSNRGNSSMA